MEKWEMRLEKSTNKIQISLALLSLKQMVEVKKSFLTCTFFSFFLETNMASAKCIVHPGYQYQYMRKYKASN